MKLMQKKSKLLGEIGGIILALSIIPSLSFFSIVGILLLLIAYYFISREFERKEIFSNALWACLIPSIFALITGIIVAIFITSTIISFLFSTDLGDFESIFFSGKMINLYILIAILWVIGWIISIVSTKMWKKANTIIAEKTSESLISTAGNIIYTGGWLTIVLVGYILIYIGFIVKTIAFFSVKEVEG